MAKISKVSKISDFSELSKGYVKKLDVKELTYENLVRFKKILEVPASKGLLDLTVESFWARVRDEIAERNVKKELNPFKFNKKSPTENGMPIKSLFPTRAINSLLRR